MAFFVSLFKDLGHGLGIILSCFAFYLLLLLADRWGKTSNTWLYVKLFLKMNLLRIDNSFDR
jgi:hypothetical protein